MDALAGLAVTSIAIGSLVATHHYSKSKVDIESKYLKNGKIVSLDHEQSTPISVIPSVIFASTWFLLLLYWAHSQGNLTTAIFGNRAALRYNSILLSNGYLVDSLSGALGVLSV